MNEFDLYLLSRWHDLFSKETYLYFPEGLLGFTESKKFSLRKKERMDEYFFLEQVEGKVRFIVCDPFHFFPSYTPCIGRSDIEALKIKEGATLLLLTLVNVKRAPPQLNLRAPLLIDWDQRMGRQIMIGF